MLLTRYTIDGVIWGINYLWLDAEGRLAMFATGGGGGLSFKTVRAALLPLRDELMDVATRAQMAELTTIASSNEAGRRRQASRSSARRWSTRPAHQQFLMRRSSCENGRIVAAGPSASTPVPPGARRIDVAGKTIVPGLWDNHAHLHQIEWIPTYIAAGVTSVRDMGSEWPLLVAMRNAIRSGKISGPNLFFAGLIDGPGPQGFGEFSAATPEEGRAIVRRYHQMGFEMIKIYLALAPDVTAAICDEAHKQGMTCTGHVPTSMDLHAAIDSGMDQIAHFPVRGDLTSDSGKKQLAHFVAKKTIFDPTASWGEIGGKSAQEPMQNIQPVHAAPPSAAAAESRRRARSIADGHGDVARASRAHAGKHESRARRRRPAHHRHRRRNSRVQRLSRDRAVREGGLHEHGRAAGRDLRRRDRRCASTNDVGTIEKGKRADLLVLDANPLDNISNIRTVRFVMKDGKMFESAALWTAAGFKP